MTTADIAEALAAKGFDLNRRKLGLPDAIKKLGEYDVPLRLHRDVTVQVKVKVVAEGGADEVGLKSQGSSLDSVELILVADRVSTIGRLGSDLQVLFASPF